MEIENQFRKGDDPETVHGKLGRTPGRSQAGGMQDGASRVSQEGAQGTAVPRGTKTLDAQRLCVCRWARPQYAGGKGGGIFFFFFYVSLICISCTAIALVRNHVGNSRCGAEVNESD